MEKQLINDENPFKISFAMQDLLVRIGDMIDLLTIEGEEYNPENIFQKYWPHLIKIVPEITGGILFGVKNSDIFIYNSINTNTIFEKWSDLESKHRIDVLKLLNNKDIKDVLFWNYNDMLLVEETPKKHACSLSWLCDLPNQHKEKLYMFLIRKIEKRPFLCHEIQAIKTTSRIIGAHLKNEWWAYNYTIFLINQKFSRTND